MSDCDGKSACVAHELALVGDVLDTSLEVAHLGWRTRLEMTWGVTQMFVSMVLPGFCAVGLV